MICQTRLKQNQHILTFIKQIQDSIFVFKPVSFLGSEWGREGEGGGGGGGGRGGGRGGRRRNKK